MEKNGVIIEKEVEIGELQSRLMEKSEISDNLL